MRKFYWYIALVILCMNLLVLTPNKADANTLSIERLAGETRLHTAVEISTKGWPNGVDNEEKAVILARADNPADALSAAGLSGVKDAPILLSYPSKLDNIVLDELSRLRAARIYVLGGTDAISKGVVDQLEKANFEVVRINGSTRFETAIEINRAAGLDTSEQAYLVNGLTVADALSASSSSAINQIPIYLTKKDNIPAELPETIKEITIIGGDAVVSPSIEDELHNREVEVNRIAGSNRFETNLKLISNNEKHNNILFVRGISSKSNIEDYPEAVTASGLSQRLNATVLLLHPKGSNQDKAVNDYLSQQNYNAYILGGLSALPDAPFSKIGIQIPAYALEVPVLTYHNILAKQDLRDHHFYATGNLNNMIVMRDQFDKQMSLLDDKGYQTITLKEFESFIKGVKHVPEKSVLITFDDGHKNNYIHAYPVLKKHGFTAVEFLVTSRVTEQTIPYSTDSSQFFSWEEVESGKDVFEYASHTHAFHSREEDTRLPYLISKSKDEIKADIQKSLELIGPNTNAFAYPYGAYNSTSIEALSELNIDMAFTVKHGTVKPGDNLMEIRRKSIRPYHSINDFEGLIEK